MSNITVTMPLAEYEEMQRDIEFWQGRFNSLYKIVIKYAAKSEATSTYQINDITTFAKSVEEFLNNRAEYRKGHDYERFS